MKIDLSKIKSIIKEGKLKDVSQETGIPLRTLEDWRYENNKWLKQTEERLTALQKYINVEESKMKLNIDEIKALSKLDQAEGNEMYYEFVNVKEGNSILSYYNLFDNNLTLTRRVKVDYTDKLKGLQRIAPKSDDKAMALPYKQIELNENYVILEEFEDTREGLESMAKSVQSKE